MKNLSMSLFVGLLSSALCFAEGGGDENWAEKAAMQYEEKAAEAAAQGNTHDAEIYLKMAQIKRDAGAASKQGKEFSWDEYHKLSSELGGGKKDKHEKHEKSTKKEKSYEKKNHEAKKEKGSPGDGFIGAAQEYQKLSIEAAKAGDSDKAAIYGELAKMKLDAAAAANRGEGYDWTEYHELRKKLEK